MPHSRTMTAGVLAVLVLAQGCAEKPSDGQIHGTAGGAAAGAAIGYAVADSVLQGTLVGAVAGALVGHAAGTWLDQPARENTAAATAQAAESGREGEVVAWSAGPRASGRVTALGPLYKDAGGRLCRDLRQDAVLDQVGRSREVTACRLDEGLWEVLDYRAPEAG